ncbi:MAG: ABC transporter substrate-binding protein, partial [Kosmotoga sp.]
MWTSFMEKNTEPIVNLSDIINPENFRPGELDNVKVDGEIIGIPYTGKV